MEVHQYREGPADSTVAMHGCYLYNNVSSCRCRPPSRGVALSSAGSEGAQAAGGRNNGKGLRHFSMKVCEKVESKGRTTYNEVADELVGEFSGAAPIPFPLSAIIVCSSVEIAHALPPHCAILCNFARFGPHCAFWGLEADAR